MFTFSTMTVRFLQGACLSIVIAAPAWLGGFACCAATCIPLLTVEGTVDVTLAGSPELTIQLCHDGTCLEDGLTWDQSPASCATGEIECSISESSDGKGHLELRLSSFEDGLEEGESVTVKVTDAATGEVLVDAKLEIDSVGSSKVCGTSCDSAVVSWDP